MDHLTRIHRAMTCYHYPGSKGAVDTFQIILHPLILRGPCSEVVLCTHHQKVNAAIIKAVPEDREKNLINCGCLVTKTTFYNTMTRKPMNKSIQLPY